MIYTNVGCGLRSVVRLLEIIDESFNGVFEGELPSHTEISNWAQKAGLSTYLGSGKGLSGKEYCEIGCKVYGSCFNSLFSRLLSS